MARRVSRLFLHNQLRHFVKSHKFCQIKVSDMELALVRISLVTYDWFLCERWTTNGAGIFGPWQTWIIYPAYVEYLRTAYPHEHPQQVLHFGPE